MNLETYRCFGSNADTGNEALVIRNFSHSESDRLNLAKEQNKNTCVFIDDIKSKTVLDFYYPHARSPLCIHATLAAGCSLLKENSSDSLVVYSALNNQEICINKYEHDFFVSLEKTSIHTSVPDIETVKELLNINHNQCIRNYSFHSVGSIKLMVEMDSVENLYALKPALKKILKWNKDHKVNGIYAYFKHHEGHFTGRNFNHLHPSLEDAATGVAAGALASLANDNFILNQGTHLNNPCVIKVLQLDNNLVQIGGQVI